MGNERVILVFERAIMYRESLNDVYLHRHLVRQWEAKYGKLLKWYRILTTKNTYKKRTRKGQAVLDMYMFNEPANEGISVFLDKFIEIVMRKDENYLVFEEKNLFGSVLTSNDHHDDT